MTTAAHTSTAESEGHGRRFLITWIALSVISTPLVAIFVGRLFPPGNGSAQATQQVFDNTWLVSIMTPVGLFVLVFLAYALLSFRARSAELVDGPAIRGDSRIQVVWMAVTGATVLFLAGFGSFELVQSGSGGGQGPTAAFLPAGSSHALDVQVIAQQWEFTYRYPSYGGVEAPHLVLPAHTLVRLHVTSLDAIHSFWAYQLGVKADANPGVDDVAYVETKSPLTFDIRCAELCGLWHGYMFDKGSIVDSAAFTKWIAQQQATFAPATKLLPKYSTSYLPDPQRRAG